MARKKTLRVAALNVAAHPHSAKKYVALLDRAASQNICVNYYGSRWGKIGTFGKDGGCYRGHIHLFTDFDVDAPWLDMAKGKAAETGAVEAIKIPKNLKPEFSDVPYVFIPQTHRLLFDANLMAPRSAQKLVQGILSHQDVLRNLEAVHVNLVQDKKAVKSLLGHSKLTYVEVHIDRPNPDDFGTAAARIEARLKKMRGATLTESITSEAGEYLKPDDEFQELSEVAAANGRINTRFRNADGITESASSVQAPLIKALRYDPEVTSAQDMIFSTAEIFKDLPNE